MSKEIFLQSLPAKVFSDRRRRTFGEHQRRSEADRAAPDLSDRVEFSLEEDSYLNFYHSNAIAEILDSNNQVVVGSSDSYSGNLKTFLTAGDYALGEAAPSVTAFSSESSISELFSASIYLSNSDPNYAIES